ncbi:MAG: ribonuclease P protein component [Elusimicrobia bacterium]|nr:ribonuclease P protein component [Elusimicrobiota bacterium]
MRENKDLKYTFRFSERLHLQKDFDKIFKSGRKAVHPAIFVYSFSRNDRSKIRRLGLITSGKLGLAVKRNTLKRRLREIFRLNKHNLKTGIDLLFIPKKAAIDMDYHKLEETVISLLEKLNAITV